MIVYKSSYWWFDSLFLETIQARAGDFKSGINKRVICNVDWLFTACDKADLGLEELSSLNVKSRYQVFEKSSDSQELERSPSTVNVKRSPSILSKLAKLVSFHRSLDSGVDTEHQRGEILGIEWKCRGSGGCITPIKGSQ